MRPRACCCSAAKATPIPPSTTASSAVRPRPCARQDEPLRAGRGIGTLRPSNRGLAMSRIVTVGAAQLGPIAKDESRKQVVDRLLTHLHNAKKAGCDLVVFPELALTTFFP